MHEAEDAAHGLGQGGGKGGRPDAPVEHADEQQVEHDVGERGENEVIERAAAVAHGVHDAGADVIEHDGDDAEEVVAEILDGLGQDLGVGAHPDEEGGREQHAGHGEDHAGDDAEGEVGMYGAGDSVLVAGSEAMRNDDTCAQRGAVKKLTMRKISVPEELTAARASVPRNCPTMTESAAL